MFRSSTPGWLGLPWELLCDPDRPTPMVLDRVAVSRTLPAAALAEAFSVGGERLRVLMVISRPRGAADVGYRMIARPLLERLEAVRGNVELVVLRPPTLDHLAEVLSKAREAGEPFQVVHFDGHGVLNGRPGTAGSGAPLVFESPAEQGVLVFEKSSGGVDHVPAADVAQVLADAQVPVVVLNACQSGAVGKQLEAAVATRLLQEGAASVVAMAYNVFPVAAAEFMTAFYERLFAGDRVSDAVSAGRARLARRRERPSPKGPMALADWVVPVHYLRRDVHFPDLQAKPAPELSLLDQVRESPAEDASDPLAPVDAFVGRDGLFFTLEVAARLQRVVVLHGQAGTGKTELAKAFGRWWRDTGGVDRPEWVIWHSFKPGVASFGLDGVVAEVGLHVFGADFARLDPAERRETVLQLLTQRRLLLIWDNFESVQSMPDPTQATPPLDAAGCEELKGFLGRIAAGGRSAVLVTSRTEETWLDRDLCRILVSGLTHTEANEYAEQILASHPDAAPRRAQRAYAELIKWLNGHPLSMRMVLPYLDTTDPQALLAGLRGTAALPGRDLLSASLAYSIDHLTTSTRRMLVALSLFQNVTIITVLSLLSQHSDVPRRFHGHTADDWARVLAQAAGVGLLSPLGRGMYGIHPALPAYLAEQWRWEQPDDYDHQRSATQAALLEAYATLGLWLYQQIHGGVSAIAYVVVDHQRRMLGSLLGYALDHGLWAQAQAIAQPLDDYWDSRGLTEEAKGWVDRARLALEAADGTPPPLDGPAGRLWLFLVGSHADRQLAAGELDAAEHTCLDIHHMLQEQPESTQQLGRLAVSHHQLGRVAQDRGVLAEAQEWYLKSLDIRKKLDDWPGMAASYHQLGVVAQLKGLLAEAQKWYLKSLDIRKKLGDWPGMAASYHQLGIVAQDRGVLDEAQKWYLDSLDIEKELGDWPGMARSYHQLGVVAQLKGLLDEAQKRCLESLTISEELGDRPGMARSYHELGVVAQDRGLLGVAQDWYLKSLVISEGLGDQRAMAVTFGQMGLLAEARWQPEEALEWMIRCVALFDEFPHHATASVPSHLARLTTILGIDTLNQCWQRVTGELLPDAVREAIDPGL